MDEFLQQDGKNRDEYTRLNNIIAESLESETEIEPTKDEAAESTTIEDEEDEGKLKKLIRYTTELIELIKEFRKDFDDDILDTVIELEELVDVYILDEFFDKEPIRTKIDEVRRRK